MGSLSRWQLLLAAPALLAGWAVADMELISLGAPDSTGGYELKSVAGSVTANGGDAALVVKTDGEARWPGVHFKAPGGAWDLSSYEALEFDLANSSDVAIRLRFRIDNPGSDGGKDCIDADAVLLPGERRKARVKLIPSRGVAGSELIKGVRRVPAEVGGVGGIDLSNVNQILIYMEREGSSRQFSIAGIRAVGEYKAIDLAGDKKLLPLIDEFGQYKHADWPGKVRAVDDMAAQRQAEEQDLAANPGPAGLNRYGGWQQGPQLRATGSFRTEKVDGKWWLVDPEGRLFFSHGIDSVGLWDTGTMVGSREGWFEGLPDSEDPQTARLYGKRTQSIGSYSGQQLTSFSHAGYNLLRKYGEDWEQTWAEVTHRRLRSWGMNTLGNWVKPEVARLRQTPYTVNVWISGQKPRVIEGGTGYWGKFYDPFDAEFPAKVAAAVEQATGWFSSVGDPWCLGYFVDNELSWGDELSFGQAALHSPADQPARIALIDDLKAKYVSIERLNDAWGTAFDSWETFSQARDIQLDTSRAGEDLKAFYSKLADRYFAVVSQSLRGKDPDHLYLGCRFAWVNPLAFSAAAKYVDVVSFNLYRASVDQFQTPAPSDVPLMVTEFHFGALDRGMWHTGLLGATSQEHRAALYKNYVMGALRHPQFVGTHWFEYQDESTTGRPLDGENYAIGFVSIADTPYPEIINAAREVGATMYQLRAGNGRANAAGGQR